MDRKNPSQRRAVVRGPVCAAALSFLFLPGAGAAQQTISNDDIVEGACAFIMPAQLIADQLVRETREGYFSGAFINPDTGEFDSALQRNAVYKYQALIKPDINALPVDPIERLSIGEILFRNFRAVESEAFFEGLADRDDLIGRLAMQRMLQLQFRAFGRYQRTLDMIEAYKERFPWSPYDVNGYGGQIANFALKYRDDGEPARGAALLIEEFEAAPASAPYQVFFLLVRHQDLIRNAEMWDDAAAAIRRKLAPLRELERRWAQAAPPASEDPLLRGVAPRWYWYSDGIRDGETFHEGRLRQLRSLIGQLEEAAEA